MVHLHFPSEQEKNVHIISAVHLTNYNENLPQKGLRELTPNQFKHKLENMKDSP